MNARPARLVLAACNLIPHHVARSRGTENGERFSHVAELGSQKMRIAATWLAVKRPDEEEHAQITKTWRTEWLLPTLWR